jgi:hypothetical protein
MIFSQCSGSTYTFRGFRSHSMMYRSLAYRLISIDTVDRCVKWFFFLTLSIAPLNSVYEPVSTT